MYRKPTFDLWNEHRAPFAKPARNARVVVMHMYYPVTPGQDRLQGGKESAFGVSRNPIPCSSFLRRNGDAKVTNRFVQIVLLAFSYAMAGYTTVSGWVRVAWGCQDEVIFYRYIDAQRGSFAQYVHIGA